MPRSNHLMILRALCLGLGGGARSLSPFAALALSYGETSAKTGWRSWAMFRERRERRMMVALASVEYVSDKLPWAQPRIALSLQPSTGDTGIVVRVALVALAGAALGSEEGTQEALLEGATFAAVGAIAGNYGGYYARKALGKTRRADVAWAFVEDVLAIGFMFVAVKRSLWQRR